MISQEEYEEKYKSVLYEKIEQMIQAQSKLIEGIQTMSKPFNLESDVDNIAITMNNKLVELKNEFQRAGISIYSQKFENYGALKLNFTVASFIGNAIISDFADCVLRATEELSNYSETIKEITGEMEQVSQELEKMSPIKRFFIRIRDFFEQSKRYIYGLTEEEKEKLKTYISNYRDMNNKLFEYNLRDDVVSSIVKEFKNKKYSPSNISELLEECVIPDLQKLGLEDLIPSIQQSIAQEYSSDIEVKKENTQKNPKETSEEKGQKEMDEFER